MKSYLISRTIYLPQTTGWGHFWALRLKRSISSAFSHLFYFFLSRESSSESILIIQDLSQVPTLNLVSLSKLVDGIWGNYTPASCWFFLCFSTKGARFLQPDNIPGSWPTTAAFLKHLPVILNLDDWSFCRIKKKQCTLSLSHKKHNKCLKYIKIFIPSGRHFDWSLWDLKNIWQNYIFCQPK